VTSIFSAAVSVKNKHNEVDNDRVQKSVNTVEQVTKCSAEQMAVLFC